MNKLIGAIEKGKLYSGYIICAHEFSDALGCAHNIAKAVNTTPYILDKPDMEGIRRLQASLNEDGQKGDAKVAIIYGDSLSEQCQNAMLKTIEEHRQDIAIVFAVTNMAVLLPTIISRCITYYPKPKSEEEILNEVGQENLVFARYAMGSLERAKELIKDEGFIKTRETAIEIMDELFNKRVYAVPKGDKDKAKGYCHYILLFLRDVLTGDIFWFFDKKDLVFSYINTFTTKEIISMIRVAKEANIKIYKKTNPMLVLDRLQLEVLEVINGNSNRG